MAINEAQEDHELLGTARALRSDQKVKVKAVTETATHYQGQGGRGQEAEEMRGKSSTSTLHCRFVSAPADSPFCQKGKLFAAQEKKKEKL